MKPQIVSFTGADDKVDISELKKLSDMYPRIEWAFLYMPEREGRVRTPSAAWRQEALKTLPRCALHLCMQTAFEQVLAQEADFLAELKRYARVQLNINASKPLFSEDEVFLISSLLLQHGIPQILQYNPATQAGINLFLSSVAAKDLDKVHVLFDSSLGRGVVPSQWPAPLAEKGLPVYCGYAGGISPDNVENLVPQIQQVCSRPYWIDMEKGVRTDNQFDLAKVELVLLNPAIKLD